MAQARGIGAGSVAAASFAVVAVLILASCGGSVGEEAAKRVDERTSSAATGREGRFLAFRPARMLGKPAPEVRWLRAGGSFRGYRFSVWIGTGPVAAEADRELALESAASLAVSGCWRDVIDDCPDQ